MAWQAMITAEYGPNAANDIGDSHELGQQEIGKGSDSMHDQANNVAGRRIGQGLQGAAQVIDETNLAILIEQFVLDAIRNGRATGENGKLMHCTSCQQAH